MSNQGLHQHIADHHRPDDETYWERIKDDTDIFDGWWLWAHQEWHKTWIYGTPHPPEYFHCRDNHSHHTELLEDV